MRVLVIGGGASGLMAAIHAARAGAEVTVLESMEKPGKKLLATGNGRCNLTNQSAGDARYYRSSEKGVQEVLKGYTPKETLADFAGLGLFVQEKQEGCMYPASGQASSVLDLLLMEAAARKVKIKCLEKAEKIWKKDRVWQVKTPGWQYEAEKVILACGSQAAPALGADGSGYVLAKMTGHTIEKPLPALVPLKIKDKDIRQLEGVRTPAEICLKTRKESFRNRRTPVDGLWNLRNCGVSGKPVRGEGSGRRRAGSCIGQSVKGNGNHIRRGTKENGAGAGLVWK